MPQFPQRRIDDGKAGRVQRIGRRDAFDAAQSSSRLIV